MTTLTPPPADSRAGARGGWITPLLTTIGVIALVGALAAAVLVGIRMFSGGHTSSDTVTTQGVTALDVDTSGADFRIEYAQVDEAVLQVEGTAGWRLERRDETVTVRPPIRWFGDWWFSNEQHVTLILPASLESQGLDADIEVNSGRFAATGDFERLVVKVNAGRAEVEGSATELEVTVNAGHAEVDARDVRDVGLEINAGRIDATLSGTAPNLVEVDVSAGQLNVTVPDDIYDLSSNISAGSLDHNGLQTASASPHRIHVSVSAGSATVRPAK